MTRRLETSPDPSSISTFTKFSLLDGLSRIPEMTKRVAEQGMGALALTDHGGMYGVIPFYAAAKKAGIKPPDPISRRLTRSRIIPPRPPAERG